MVKRTELGSRQLWTKIMAWEIQRCPVLLLALDLENQISHISGMFSVTELHASQEYSFPLYLLSHVKDGM